jgi:N-acetylglucosaminyldiphosphoundecaprenol N-acetyl-beta-D-mannosaminyltransferase
MMPTLSEPRTIRLFDLDLHAEPLEVTARRCISLAERSRKGPAGAPSLVFSLNPEKAVKSCRDPGVKELLRRATILNPDGVGICLAARLLANERLQRVAGSDLMPRLCALAQEAGLTVYVYGASPASNAAAVDNMRRRWPGLRIVGASDGFQPSGSDGADGNTVAARIAALQPDIVFVGLGSPRQEVWMAEVGATLPVGLLQGVGGTIDVLSGVARRAPPAWRRLGLEWLYRLLEDPRRWRRQLALIDFAMLVLRRHAGELVFGNARLAGLLPRYGTGHKRGRV